MQMQPFNPSPEPRTCLYCGRKLREKIRAAYRPLTDAELARWQPLAETRDAAQAVLRARYRQDEITHQQLHRGLRATRRAFAAALVGPLPRGSSAEVLGPYDPDSTRVLVRERSGTYGLNGLGHFDTLACAAGFGEIAAHHGCRYVRAETSPTPET